MFPVSSHTLDSRPYFDNGAKGSFPEELQFLELVKVARKLSLHAGDERRVEDVAARDN